MSMRWHWTTVVALGWLTAVLLPGRLCAQDPLYWKRNAPADARVSDSAFRARVGHSSALHNRVKKFRKMVDLE